MYNKIVNPKTGRKVNINGKIGREILRNYILFSNGGAAPIYKKKCRSKKNPDKLNKLGLKEYKEYKNICPNHRELTWDANICRDKSVNTTRDYAKYAARYKDCHDERVDFTSKCINYSDPGHSFAINKMYKYANECKSRGEGRHKQDFNIYYDCYNNNPNLSDRQAKLCYRKKTKKAKIASLENRKPKSKKPKTWANIVQNN